jgi:N-acetylmuramoyl-L-alanine amidase
MTRNRLATNYIVIHSSATPPSAHVDAAVIDRWHRARGWLGIGYHKVIRRDGVVVVGRPEAAVGAHAGPEYNAVSVAVCMAGGVAEGDVSRPEKNFTPEQWASLEALVRDWKSRYPNAQIVGHRDLNPTECPSFDVKEWAASVGL